MSWRVRRTMKSFLDRYYNETQGGTVGISFFHAFKSRYLNAFRSKSFCLPEEVNQETPLCLCFVMLGASCTYAGAFEKLPS